MRFTLEVRLTNSEGVLERILGRLRQRNLSICALVANLSQDHSIIDARITVDGNKACDAALKQVAKLFDVQQLRVTHSSGEQQFGHGHLVGMRNEVYLSV